jgi:hypothetical protein
LVPFETLKLPGCLGSSNEPYLNKPARFVSLSLTNAVRRGRDFQTLSDVIDVLSNISSSSDAYKYLKSALSVMKEVSKELKSKTATVEKFKKIRLSAIKNSKVWEDCEGLE